MSLQAILVSHRNKHNAHLPQAAGCQLHALGPSRFDHGNWGNSQARSLDLSLSNTCKVYVPNWQLTNGGLQRKQCTYYSGVPLRA